MSPTRGTCETSQVLLAGVSGGFSQGSLVFAAPTDLRVSYERDDKLNHKVYSQLYCCELECNHGIV